MKRSHIRLAELIVIALFCFALIMCVNAEEHTSAVQAGEINNTIHFRLGAEEVSEPFNFFQDGSFGILHENGKIYVLPPVNNVDTCDQFVWSGNTVDDLYPLTEMNGLTANSHYYRGRIYDAYGWWPFSLWADCNGKWYSYMHTEDAIQVDTGNVGHGSDLRTIALWTSVDKGANWTYEGVAVSIDSDYAVPGNLQPTWPRNGGTGDHKLIASPDGQYLYLLYTVFTYDDPSESNDYCHGNLAIARAEIDENGVPGAFYKYYNNSFSQPAVGGHESWIMTKTDAVYATDNSQRSVMWNTYLQKYVMISADRIHHLNISYSDDLIHWTKPEVFLQEEAGVPLLYVNMVSFASNDQVGGKSVWVYYVTNNYEVRRRILTFDVGENLAYQKLATASYSNLSHPASTVTDNHILSGYQGPKAKTSYTNTWIYIDLQKTQQFNTIWLTPSLNGKGFPTCFSFEGSNDLNSWTAISSYSHYRRPLYEETQVFSVGAQAYRYVRLSVSECSEIGAEPLPFALQINEFKILNLSDVEDERPEYHANARVYSAQSDFSAVQGLNNWSYMRQGDLNIGLSYFWSPMTYNTQMLAWGRSGMYSYVGSDWMHPDDNYQTARIWKAPADGMVHITGRIFKRDISGGDGVRVKILRNREHIWPANSEWQTIAFNDLTGVYTDIYLRVSANEKIFFVIDAIDNAQYDSTYWSPTIAFVPITNIYNSCLQFSSQPSSWQYFAGTASGYEPLQWNNRWGKPNTYCFVAAQQMHPDADADAVRAWTAPASGVIDILNTVKKLDVTGGDGVRIRIMKNETQIWPASGWYTVEYNCAEAITQQLSTEVATGDTIYFVLNRNADSSYDTTYWEAEISFAEAA